MAIRTIGFIGIGNMGRPMAANLIKGGFKVVAYDTDIERAAQFAEDCGGDCAATLADLGSRVDAVVTMLPTGKEVRACLLEAEGGALAAGLPQGAIVIDMSSADPVGTRKTHADLAKRGIAFVDAPVSGGVPRATDGTLAIMIGGDPAAVAAARPVLEKMGTRLFDVGGPGNGHAMKALNNFVAGTGFIAVAEAVLVGKRFGLDPNVMIDIMNVSTGKNFNTENVVKQHVISGAFASGFALGLLAKDVKIAADLAEDLRAHAPVSQLSRDMWARARDRIGATADHSAAIKYWEMLNGVTVGEEGKS